jgi:transposase
MRAYSDDLRQRILRAVDQGHRQAEIAAAFQVSVATIKRYLKLRRETGQVTVKPIPGRPPTKRAALEAELAGQLAAYRDVTQGPALSPLRSCAWRAGEPGYHAPRH